jgi:hypothetical protein
MHWPLELARNQLGVTSLSISTPGPYRVPSTNGFLSVIEFSIFGALSGGCYSQLQTTDTHTCKSASIQIIASPLAS